MPEPIQAMVGRVSEAKGSTQVLPFLLGYLCYLLDSILSSTWPYYSASFLDGYSWLPILLCSYQFASPGLDRSRF